MSIRKMLTVYTTLAVLACTTVAVADAPPYTEGSVVNVARIRTVDGKFDDYMKWLSTTWKQQQEASKKAGNIVSYEILLVEPRTEDDANLLLITRYKNWAALDGARAKEDAVVTQVEGSVTAANESQAARSKIRRVLGSSTMQVLDLK